MRRITLTASMSSHIGYGRHAQQIVRGLAKHDIQVSIRPINSVEKMGAKIPSDILAKYVSGPQPEEWEILLHPPSFVPTPGKKTVFFSMWESTQISETSVEYLNRADVIVVPCKWNAKCFAESGVTKPIRIVPLGIDPEVFKYQPPSNGNKFVFGCAGRIANGDRRKGLKDVIIAFSKAFPKSNRNVQLWVKGFQDCALPIAADDRVVITEKYLEPDEYAAWLGKLDCFVSAARGEGWGWHQHEAMAVGRPLIACQYGGLAEFFNPDCGIPVPYKEWPASEVWEGLGLWAEPNTDGLIAAMQSAYTNWQQLPEIGKKASASALRFTEDHATEKLLEVLEEFGALGQSKASSKNQLVSIVLPLYRRVGEFREVAKHTQAYYHRDFETVIAMDDPEGEKELVKFVKEEGIRAKVIVNDTPHEWRPPCKALNVAIKHSSGEYILMLDPEIVLMTKPSDIVALIEREKKGGDFFMVGRLFNFGGDFDKDKLLDMNSPGYGFLLAARKDLIRLNGMDESRKTYGGDDDDIRIRLKLDGVRCVVEPSIVVAHKQHERRRPPRIEFEPYGHTIVVKQKMGEDFNRIACDLT